MDQVLEKAGFECGDEPAEDGGDEEILRLVL